MIAPQPKAPGKLYVLSAPSGAGKTTVTNLLRAGGHAKISISHTTRARRPTEADGVSYFFVGEDEFFRLREAGEFLEWAHVYGHWYGTQAAWVDSQLASGSNVLLEIDCQGARKVKERRPQAVLLFLRPSRAEALRQRLLARAEDAPEQIEARLAAAAGELAQEKSFDHVIINDRVEDAFNQIVKIMRAQGKNAEGAPAQEGGKNGKNHR